MSQPTLTPETKSKVLKSLQNALDPCSILERNGITPDAWQREVLRTRPKRGIILSCRQAGKSTVAAALALHRAIYFSNSEILIISARHNQAMELIKKAKELLPGVKSDCEVVAETLQTIVLKNGSRIMSLPSTADTIRGYSSVKLVVIDEAAFVGDDVYTVLKPMLQVSKGSLLLISTPNTVQGFFAQIWSNSGTDYSKEALHIQDNWQRYYIDADNNPRLDPSQLQEDKEQMGEDEFNREYHCKFLGMNSSTNLLKPFDKAMIESIPVVRSSSACDVW